MFKKEWISCPVINKTRNTYFLFLITAPFFQTLFFMVSGTGHMSTLDKQCNCFPCPVLQTQHLLKYCRTCTWVRGTNPLHEVSCSYLPPDRKVTVTQKDSPFGFHLNIHACTNKIPSLASHSLPLTISGPLGKNRTVIILSWYWLLQIIHMFCFVQDRTIIKGALEPKVIVWPALRSAKWSYGIRKPASLC